MTDSLIKKKWIGCNPYHFTNFPNSQVYEIMKAIPFPPFFFPPPQQDDPPHGPHGPHGE